MGMTFWLKTERESTSGAGDRDLSFLCKAHRQLDELCEALGVATISSFVDEGEAGAELARLFPELELEASSDSQWAEAADGARTFRMLLETMLGNRGGVFRDDAEAMLMEELEFVLDVLEDVGGGRFCLTLIS